MGNRPMYSQDGATVENSNFTHLVADDPEAQHLPTWIFDVELLLLAKQLGIPVAEVPIEWHEVAGSKLNVMTASFQMLRDLLIVRANHLLGRWQAIPTKTKSE